MNVTGSLEQLSRKLDTLCEDIEVLGRKTMTKFVDKISRIVPEFEIPDGLDFVDANSAPKRCRKRKTATKRSVDPGSKSKRRKMSTASTTSESSNSRTTVAADTFMESIAEEENEEPIEEHHEGQTVIDDTVRISSHTTIRMSVISEDPAKATFIIDKGNDETLSKQMTPRGDNTSKEIDVRQGIVENQPSVEVPPKSPTLEETVENTEEPVGEEPPVSRRPSEPDKEQLNSKKSSVSVQERSSHKSDKSVASAQPFEPSEESSVKKSTQGQGESSAAEVQQESVVVVDSSVMTSDESHESNRAAPAATAAPAGDGKEAAVPFKPTSVLAASTPALLFKPPANRVHPLHKTTSWSSVATVGASRRPMPWQTAIATAAARASPLVARPGASQREHQTSVVEKIKRLMVNANGMGAGEPSVKRMKMSAGTSMARPPPQTAASRLNKAAPHFSATTKRSLSVVSSTSAAAVAGSSERSAAAAGAGGASASEAQAKAAAARERRAQEVRARAAAANAHRQAVRANAEREARERAEAIRRRLAEEEQRSQKAVAALKTQAALKKTSISMVAASAMTRAGTGKAAAATSKHPPAPPPLAQISTNNAGGGGGGKVNHFRNFDLVKTLPQQPRMSQKPQPPPAATSSPQSFDLTGLLSEYDSNSDDEEAENRYKDRHVPSWARKGSAQLTELMMRQYRGEVRWQDLFVPAEDVHFDDAELFHGYAFRMRPRGSSVHWTSPSKPP